MLILITFVCLIAVLVCLRPPSLTGTGRRYAHVGALNSLAAALALISLLALFVLWPAFLARECSWLGYCRIGLDDTWVWIWMVPVGILCLGPFGLFLGYMLFGEWERDWCCSDRPHTYHWEAKEWAVRRREQQDRLASLGFTEEQCWDVLRNVVLVAAGLGGSRADDDGRELEYSDDRIRIRVWGWKSVCSISKGSLAQSQCEEDCWHGEELRVWIVDSDNDLEVLRAVNSELPSVSVFRPGEWIAYLAADLGEKSRERIVERVAEQIASETAARKAAEEARERDLDSRFAWVEDSGSYPVGGGGATDSDRLHSQTLGNPSTEKQVKKDDEPKER